MKNYEKILGIILALVGICIAVIGLVPAFGQWLFPISQNSKTASPLTSTGLSVTSQIIGITPPTPSESFFTSTPSPTLTLVSSPTESPTPTETPLTPTATPTLEVLFHDSFENDLSKWTVYGLPPSRTNNKIIISNDSATTTDAYGAWMGAQFQPTQNFMVVVDYDKVTCGGNGVITAPVFEDTFHMIGLQTGACGGQWVYTSGNANLNGFPGTGGRTSPGEQHLVILVEKNKLSATLNNVTMGSVVNTLYSMKQIGIFIETGALVKEVTIYALP